MIATDAVRLPPFSHRNGRLLGFVGLVAAVLGTVVGWNRGPVDWVWGLATVLILITTFAALFWCSVWLEPGAGAFVFRRWRRFERRHPLRPDSRVYIEAVPMFDRVSLRVYATPRTRYGFWVPLLCGEPDLMKDAGDWGTADPSHLHLLADTLDQHCGDAARDVVPLLRAQAEHVAAGYPLSSSPLAPMLGGQRPEAVVPVTAGRARDMGVVLTDADLEVLCGPFVRVATPHLDPLGARARRRARATARRSLIDRGVLRPVSAGPASPVDGPVDPGLILDDAVRAVVDARLRATAVLGSVRTSATADDAWYAHVQADVVVLEQVGSDGLHRFALTDPRDLPDALVAALVHPETRDGTGRTITVPEPGRPSWVAEDAAGTTYLRTFVALHRPLDQHPTRTDLVTGPTGAWAGTTAVGAHGPTTLHPTTRQAVHTYLHDLARHVTPHPAPETP